LLIIINKLSTYQQLAFASTREKREKKERKKRKKKKSKIKEKEYIFQEKKERNKERKKRISRENFFCFDLLFFVISFVITCFI
jgi:hypothetical protein